MCFGKHIVARLQLTAVMPKRRAYNLGFMYAGTKRFRSAAKIDAFAKEILKQHHFATHAACRFGTRRMKVYLYQHTPGAASFERKSFAAVSFE